jgi:uncharacterized protein (TIGR00266 family)
MLRVGWVGVVNIDVRGRPSYAMAWCQLEFHERVFVEREAMAAMSDHIHVAASTGGTGVARALVRQAATGESAVFTAYTAEVEGAWVAVCPKLPGDVVQVAVDPGEALVVESGSLLAYSEGVSPHLRYGGVRGVLMREGLVFIKLTGSGVGLLSAYGGIEPIPLEDGQVVVVDTGHIVAFSDSMEYQIGPLGGVATAALSGEGLVAKFTGPGTVLIQTRSEAQLRNWLEPKPPRR